MTNDFVLIAWLGLILGLAFLGGFLAKKAKQPSVVGTFWLGF